MTQGTASTLEWVGRRENLVVCGPPAPAKTFLLEALGQQAVEQGLRVAWFTLETLGVLLRRHSADGIGLLPVSADAAEGLYRLVDAAYETRSVALSSNLHPAALDELMPKTLATDRRPAPAPRLSSARPPATACACPRPWPGTASSLSPTRRRRWHRPERAPL